MKTRIQLITKQHDRKGFNCGHVALNEYLSNTARQNNERQLSRTYALVHEHNSLKIIGYYTLAPCMVETPSGLPRNKKYLYPYPAIKLARLAIDKAFQGKGYGELLLIDAINKVVISNSQVGGVGLFVDATNNSAISFYEPYGFINYSDKVSELFLPIQDCIAVIDSM